MESKVADHKSATQQTDQDGQTESTDDPSGHAEGQQSAQPEGRSRLPAPGHTGLAQEVGQGEMNEDQPQRGAASLAAPYL